MSYLQYVRERERERERTPYLDSDSFYSRPLVRSNSKRQRVDLYSDDDEYDDYPYPTKAAPVQPVQPSRALTIRQPSQLEKYNVWSYAPTHAESGRRTHDRYHKSADYDDGQRYKYTTTTSHKHYAPHPMARTYPSDDENEDDRHDREFKLKIKASFGRPKSALSRSNSISANAYSGAHKAMAWSGHLFNRKEKWEDTAWETKERVPMRGRETRGFWEDEEPKKMEKEVRFRTVKRTKTDEWRPLSGFRRD